MTGENLYLTPGEPFPAHVEKVSDQELQVLDSQVQRQIDHESWPRASRTRKPSSAGTSWTRNSRTGTNANGLLIRTPLRSGCAP